AACVAIEEDRIRRAWRDFDVAPSLLRRRASRRVQGDPGSSAILAPPESSRFRRQGVISSLIAAIEEIGRGCRWGHAKMPRHLIGNPARQRDLAPCPYARLWPRRQDGWAEIAIEARRRARTG